jgi:hypothetical protein
MTLGDGIFYSTVLLVLAGATYFISVNGKWKLVTKILGAFVFAGVAIAIYIVQEIRPDPPGPLAAVTEYMGVELGAPRIEVTLALGEPEDEGEIVQSRTFGRFQQRHTYPDFTLAYSGVVTPDAVLFVCSNESSSDLLNISNGASESLLLERLGEPSTRSINRERKQEAMSYWTLNAAFIIEAGRVLASCMVESGVNFVEEYAFDTAENSL